MDSERAADSESAAAGEAITGCGDIAKSYETYLETWRHSAEAKMRAHEQLDSNLLKLSAGALALSVSPAAGFFEGAPPVARWLLVVGWVLYLVAIGATMVSFRSSAKSCDDMVAIAYRAMLERDSQAATDQKAAIRPTHTLNTIAIVSFLAALLLTVSYLAITFLA